MNEVALNHNYIYSIGVYVKDFHLYNPKITSLQDSLPPPNTLQLQLRIR